MREITNFDIEQLLWQARKSERKRAILMMHQHEEPVQRMINALIPGTYIPPHKHEDPDKVELLSLLYGHVAVLQFNDIGEVDSVLMMSETSMTRIIEIPPRVYHSVIAIQPSALLEIAQGPYDEATHKRFASWAPAENTPKARDYVIYMTSIVDNWHAKQI